MTDKEKLDRLIAEIERRITFFKKQSVRKTTTDDNSCALALQGVLCFYDSMQKEPVKIKNGCKYRCLSDMINNDTGNISFVAGKIYLAPEDDTLVSEEYGWLCDTSENSSNFELVEEPVSEDLEKAAEQDVCEIVNTCSATGIPNDHIPSWVQDAMVNEFIHGANWKEQQMMSKAIEATCFGIQGAALFTFRLPAGSYLVGSEVKVIIVKSE